MFDIMDLNQFKKSIIFRPWDSLQASGELDLELFEANNEADQLLTAVGKWSSGMPSHQFLLI
jgi:hypothetical protein